MRQSSSVSLIASCLLLAACGTSGEAPRVDSGAGGVTGTGGAPGSGGALGSGGAGTLGTGGQSDPAPQGTGGSATGGAAMTGGRGAGGSGGAGERGGQGGPSGSGGAGGPLATGGGNGQAGRPGTGGAGNGSGGAGGASSCATPPAASPLVGWAAASGMNLATTTGGGTAAPQVVTTASALAAAAAGTGASVIYVKGVLSNAKISVGSNKTIVGLCGAEVHGHLGLSGSSNVIIRNLKIVGYGVGNCALDPDYTASVGCSSGNDAITVSSGSHHLWFDHCDISDGTDGNLDITNGSDFVTVSWTKFHYTPRTDTSGNDSTGAEGHRFSNLIGAGDGLAIDAGHLNVTWHHDWWADNVSQRMPRTRSGKIHVFNSLYTSTGNSYCTNAGDGAHLLVENNVSRGVKGPLQVASNGDMLARNNLFTNTSGTTTANGTGFTPSYSYMADPAATVESDVRAGAGPK